MPLKAIDSFSKNINSWKGKERKGRGREGKGRARPSSWSFKAVYSIQFI